jgi:hypothetical protein
VWDVFTSITYVKTYLSTTVYRTTMVKFLLSRDARRDLTVPPFASLHRNIVMHAVALISIRGGNRHTCVRGSVSYQNHSRIYRGKIPDEVCSPSQILLHWWHRSKPQNDSNSKNKPFHPNFSKKWGWSLPKCGM